VWTSTSAPGPEFRRINNWNAKGHLQANHLGCKEIVREKLFSGPKGSQGRDFIDFE